MFGEPYVVYLVPIKTSAGEVIGILCNFVPARVLSQQVTETKIWLSLALAGTTLIGLVVMGLTLRKTLRPLRSMEHMMERIRNGQLDGEVTATDRTDEIGGFARAIDAWRNSILEARRLPTRTSGARQSRTA